LSSNVLIVDPTYRSRLLSIISTVSSP
jgi:hypothetical protein